MNKPPRKSLALVQDRAGLLAKIKARLVVDDNGCHLWLAGKANGYGVVGWEGRTWTTHRLMYEFTHGPVTEEQARLFVLHPCDVPSCCNPVHLILGTPGQNDREAADRCLVRYGYRGSDPGERGRKVGTVFYEFRGEVKSLHEWASQFSLNIYTLDLRFARGIPEESIPLPPSVRRRTRGTSCDTGGFPGCGKSRNI